VAIGGFITVTPVVFIGAVSSSDGLGADGSQSSAGKDLLATALSNLSVLVGATGEQSSDAGAGKGTLCEVAFVVVIRVLALLAASGAARVVIVIIVAVIVVPSSRAAVALVGANLSPFPSVIILFVVGGGTNEFSVPVPLPEHNDVGFLPGNDNLLRRGFLDDDFLVWSSLADHDGGRRMIWLMVIISLLAITIDLMAMAVVKALLDSLFHAHILFMMARASLPVAIRLPALDIAFVVGGAAAISVDVYGRAWPVGHICPLPSLILDKIPLARVA
jgi:hypothetical protein